MSFSKLTVQCPGGQVRVRNNAAAAHSGRRRRRLKCLVAAVAALPVLVPPALGMATAAAPEAVDVLPHGPTRVLTLSLFSGGPDDDLKGVVCQGQRSCEPLAFPYIDRTASIAIFDNALRADGSPGQQIGFGYSQGARVVADWIDVYAGTKGAPTPDELSFVLIGNPGRKYGGSRVKSGEMTPDSDYRILDVTRQYDLSSDVPDDTSNLLAMANAYLGFASVHTAYEEVDIYDPANYVWTEGNTTYVFAPTEQLPILGFMYSLGLTNMADSVDAVLRPEIEKAYDRSYLPAQPGWPSPAPESGSDEPPAEKPTESGTESPPTQSAINQTPSEAANVAAATTDHHADSGSETVDAGFDLHTEDAGSASTGVLDDDPVESEIAEGQSAEAETSAPHDSDFSTPSSSEDPVSAGDDPSAGGREPDSEGSATGSAS